MLRAIVIGSGVAISYFIAKYFYDKNIAKEEFKQDLYIAVGDDGIKSKYIIIDDEISYHADECKTLKFEGGYETKTYFNLSPTTSYTYGRPYYTMEFKQSVGQQYNSTKNISSMFIEENKTNIIFKDSKNIVLPHEAIKNINFTVKRSPIDEQKLIRWFLPVYKTAELECVYQGKLYLQVEKVSDKYIVKHAVSHDMIEKHQKDLSHEIFMSAYTNFLILCLGSFIIGVNIENISLLV